MPGLSEEQRAARACIGMVGMETASADIVGGKIGATMGRLIMKDHLGH